MRRFFFGILASGLLGLLSAVPAFGQTVAAVSGAVTDASGQPVPFATATLHRAADSVAVKTEFTNEAGAFRLEAGVGARYRVSVAQLGFQRYWSAPFEVP